MSKYNDKMTEVTHYDAKGAVLRVDKTVFKKGETSDVVVNDKVRVQPEEKEQDSQIKTKRRVNKSSTRKRGR